MLLRGLNRASKMIPSVILYSELYGNNKHFLICSVPVPINGWDQYNSVTSPCLQWPSAAIMSSPCLSTAPAVAARREAPTQWRAATLPHPNLSPTDPAPLSGRRTNGSASREMESPGGEPALSPPRIHPSGFIYSRAESLRWSPR